MCNRTDRNIVDPSKWTQAEIDMLVDCRNRSPPMAYRDISAKMQAELQRTRSDKACREQMTTLNRKKKGFTRVRAPTSAPGNHVQSGLSGVPNNHDAGSPLGQRPMNAEDTYRSEAEDLSLLEQAGRRASRASRRGSRGQQTPTAAPAAAR